MSDTKEGGGPPKRKPRQLKKDSTRTKKRAPRKSAAKSAEAATVEASAAESAATPGAPPPTTRTQIQPTLIALGALFGLVVGVLIGINAFSSGPREGTPSSDMAAAPEAAPALRWQLASAFPAKLTQLGTSGTRFVETARQISGGTIEMRFLEPGEVVEAQDVFAAVARGEIDAGWTTPGYLANEIPAAAVFTAVPFGPDAGGYLAWIRFGGGQAIYDELYEPYGVKGLVCAIAAPEASGWFREEVKSVNDLKGLKMRFFGLGADVMAKLGVTTRLPAGDVYPALEQGLIDALEYSMPAVDVDLGFDRLAKHYYFPGWHQQATILELLVNREAWNALGDQQRAQIEAACGTNLQHTIAEGEAIQYVALAELQARGVVIHRWSPEMLAAFEKAWLEVAEEAARADPDFRRAWASLQAFRADHAVWRELGYLE